MGWRLAPGRRIVMATEACAGDLGMIEGHRMPVGRHMAGFAGVGTRHMGNGFPCGPATIVTADTSPDCASVIEMDIGPRGCHMAGFAIV